MASLTIHPIETWPDSVVSGGVRLDAREPGRTPVQYRLASCVADLPVSVWRPLTNAVVDVPRLWPGYQVAGPITVAAEIEYLDSSSCVVTDVALPGYPPPPPLATPPTEPGYLMHATFATGAPWWVQQYNDTTPAAGNNFLPLDWAPGYVWSTEQTRAIDVGETPDDIIAVHTYARWVKPTINTWDFGPNTTGLSATLSGTLNLNGGAAYFAVLCVFPDGRRGRYHLYSPARRLTIGPAPTETAFGFPSGSHPDWMCSFAADGVPLSAMPHGPSFAIEAVEIILRDFTSPPTGVLRLHDWAVRQ